MHMNTSVTQAADGARENRRLLCERLHTAADFLAAHPEISADGIVPDAGAVTIRDYGAEREDLIRVSHAVGGRWDKREVDDLFYLSREVADGVRVELVAWRKEVCERVVVGTETVEIPDPAAPKVTVERDVIEWKCKPVLAADVTL